MKHSLLWNQILLIHPMHEVGWLENQFEKFQGKPVVLFLDFDGTLVFLADDPNSVCLSEKELEIISRLAAIYTVTIVSGRTRAFLESTFAKVPVNLAAEHGSFYKGFHDEIWTQLSVDELVDSSPKELDELLEEEELRLPGTRIEHKSLAKVFHYRQIKEEENESIIEGIARRIEMISNKLRLSFLRGKSVFEVRWSAIHKGGFIRWYLEKYPSSSQNIIAIGDDVTDEKMFSVVNELNGLTIKVGPGETLAQHRINSPVELWSLLEKLVD